MINIGTLTGRIELEDSASSAIVALGNNLTAAGRSFSSAGSALSIGITAPLVAAAGASLMFSSNFEASMTRLVSLAGTSADQLENVKQHILALAPATGVGPQALADAMTKVSSTVTDSKVALEILDMAARGSAAGMGTALDVAGALTAVVNSYGEKNITAAHAADVLTMAVKDGGAEAKELAPTLANVVPIAAQLGISFEEVAANIATVTKLGVPASEAVTQLSSVMSALLKETKQGSEALASLTSGPQSYDELRKAIKDRGLTDVLIDLTKQFGENKTGLTDVFGRIEALRDVMSSAGQQADTYREVLDHMGKSVGTLDKAFSAMTDTQTFKWGQLTAALQVTAIKFGDSLAPAMGDILKLALPLVEKIGTLAGKFSELSPAMQTGVIALGGVTAAIGPALYLIGGMATGVGALVTLWGSLGLTFAGIVLPMQGLMLAIGAVVTSSITLWNSWKLLSETNERIAADTRQLSVDQLTLARISGVAQIAFKTLAEAEVWVRENNVQLQKESLTLSANQKQLSDTAKKLAEEEQKGALATKEWNEAMANANGVIGGYDGVMDQLGGKVIEAIKYYRDLNVSVKDTATLLGILELQVSTVDEHTSKETETVKKATVAHDKFTESMDNLNAASKGYKAVADEIDGSVAEAIIYYHKLGGTVQDMTEMYGVHERQVEAVIKRYDKQVEAAELLKKAGSGAMYGISAATQAANAELMKMSKIVEGIALTFDVTFKTVEEVLAAQWLTPYAREQLMKNFAKEAPVKPTAPVFAWGTAPAPNVGNSNPPPTVQPAPPAGGIVGGGAGIIQHNYWNVNGTAVDVAQQIKKIIMNDLKLTKQFGAG